MGCFGILVGSGLGLSLAAGGGEARGVWYSDEPAWEVVSAGDEGCGIVPGVTSTSEGGGGVTITLTDPEGDIARRETVQMKVLVAISTITVTVQKSGHSSQFHHKRHRAHNPRYQGHE